MTDALLIFSIICFAAGLMFSAQITYGDLRAPNEPRSVAWQTTLVAFDLVQAGLLLFCLVLTIVMMKGHRLNWAERIVSSAVQSMSATNVSSRPFYEID